tara:strand:- start:1081 stop:1923 length:843 start_codon:yes stop_codon:yes gene_type:complete
LQIINNDNLWPHNWGRKTSIMGILNITPDSFSDGGDFFNIKKALKQAEKFVTFGVDIIDLGAQSTRPGAEEVGSKEEIKRLIPTLQELRKRFPDLIISVDTFNADVAYKSLLNGANWVNDVTGGRRDENILDIVSQSNCPFVITHSKGNSKNMNDLSNYDNLLEDIINELKHLTEKALSKGVNQNQIIWDPGIGFAKNTSQNITILKNLKVFKEEGFPLLIGASRKRFIGEVLKISNPKDRDIGSLAISCLCSQFNIEVVRVHNVEYNYQILKMADQIYR